MITTTIKPKACKVCRTTFTPARPMASCCSPMCALDRTGDLFAQIACKPDAAQ